MVNIPIIVTKFKRSEIIKSGFWALLLRVLSLLITSLFIWVIARWYGPVVAGIFALSQAVLRFFVLGGKLGFDTAIMRLTAQYRFKSEFGNLTSAYTQSLVFVFINSLLISAIAFYFSDFIAVKFFDKPTFGQSLRLVAMSITPMSILFLNSFSLRGLKQIKEYMLFSMVLPFLIGVTIMVVLHFLNNNNSIPLLSYVIGIWFTAIISQIVWLKTLSTFNKDKTVNIAFKKIFNVALPMFLTGSFIQLIEWMDTIVLGALQDERDVGIYSVAARIARLMGLTLFAVSSISAPKFAELKASNDKKALEELVKKTTKLIFLTTLPILLITLVFHKMILGFFGSEFIEGTYILFILLLGQFINSISGSVMYLLQMTGYEKVGQNIMLSAAFINLALNYLFVSLFGTIGAAIATSICLIYWNLLGVIYIKRKLGIWTYYNPIADLNIYLKKIRFGK